MNLGGIQTLLMTLYRNIDRSKVQFDFVCEVDEECIFNEEIRKLGGIIYYVPKLSSKNIFVYYHYWLKFFEEHPEYSLIHGHVRSSAVFYLLAAKRHKIKSIIHSHSQFRNHTISGYIKEALQYPIRLLADYTMACSVEAARYLFGEKVSKTTYILGNFINVEKFLFDGKRRNEVRKELLLNDQMVIGTVGRVVEEKNPFFVIDIASELVKKDIQFKFLWVGDGYLIEEVRARLREEKLDDYFILVGSKENVADYLFAMDVFILCSKSEGFGISAIESQASGLPTLLSEVIPSEVALTPLAKRLSIDDGAKPWGDAICGCTILENRKQHFNAIAESEFNVTVACAKISIFYRDIIVKVD